MKLVIFVSLLFINFFSKAIAQTNPEKTQSGIPIEMLFPQGKTKALILSNDDGRTEDRLLVKLMNKYGLIGTFHLNSNKLGTNGYLTKEEIKKLFAGHEVSVHSANHPNLTALSKIDVIYEIAEDRKELERLTGYPVRGMAYPFGNTNEMVIDAIKGLGIEYARTVGDTYDYKIPENFLKWQPTIHLFGKTNYIPNDTANDKKELGFFYKVINDFISTKDLALLDVWGHSWEMGNDQAKWDETEKLFKLLANNTAIHYTTQIDLVDYMNAFRNLKFSVEKNIVYNPGSVAVFFRKNGKMYSVPSGMTIYLTNGKGD
jgi:peptidoglycan/xylan/chitin deacetylase (PgdA/CDA1 family)